MFSRGTADIGAVHSNGSLLPPIMILCRSLEVGGAERQLVELASGMKSRGCNISVGVFYPGGPLSADLMDAHVAIIDLGKRGRWDIVGFLFRTARVLRSRSTGIVYSFLGGANILSALIRCLAPSVHLVWSIRASNVQLARYGRQAQLSYAAERALCRLPDAIIANSEAGSRFAISRGFPEDRITVIPNGIDVDRFKPDAVLRAKQRHAWGISESEIVVGIVARLDPMKDHPTFLRAAALLTDRRPELHFICAGEGRERARLEALSTELGIANRIKFTGTVDPVEVLNGVDLVCSSSNSGEGFPNVIAEAMACGKTCVVTNVGDSALILGPSGTVVRPNDPQALAVGVLHELALQSPKRSAAARQRIVDCFSVDSMVDETIALLEQLYHHGQGPRSLA